MQSDFICWFLLALFIGVFADNRTVEQGSLVLLFENVVANNTEKEVNLFVNGVVNPTLVVTFRFVNEFIETDWKTDNYSKIFMDAKRNIKIANIDETYERKYYIYPSTEEVELTILKTNSTTVRTDQNETTQKVDVLLGYAMAILILMVIVILFMKDPIIAWIHRKKSNSVPQPVQVTSHRDSPDSTSYQLTWVKPDDGGSPLLKYYIQYCEVEIITGRTEYELSKYLEPLKYVDNILPSAVSYELSPLTPGRYYQVQIQAINTQGPSLKSFIFKTNEGKDEQEANGKSKKSTARSLKSHDSESNNEHGELLPKGACGSKLPINESEADIRPLVHLAGKKFHKRDKRKLKKP